MWLYILWVLEMTDRVCPRCKGNVGLFTVRHRCRRKVESQPDNTRQVQFAWRMFNKNYVWTKEELDD